MLNPHAAARKDARFDITTLQHRHFAAIAGIIAAMVNDDERRAAARHFVRCLANSNPRFNRERFIAACGV